MIRNQNRRGLRGHNSNTHIKTPPTIELQKRATDPFHPGIILLTYPLSYATKSASQAVVVYSSGGRRLVGDRGWQPIEGERPILRIGQEESVCEPGRGEISSVLFE